MEQSRKEKFINEAKRLAEDCLYTSKSHFNQAKDWSNIHLFLGIPSAILSAIASVSAFNNHPLVAGCLSVTVAASAAVMTFLNPNEKVIMNQKAGNDYNALRGRLRIFYEIEVDSTDDKMRLLNSIKQFHDEKKRINNQSPLISSRKAFEEARKGVEDGEADYSV